MKKLACLFALLFTVGCAKAVYRPYVGAQQAWPTAEGSIVNVKYDLPVFTSLPPAPYDVLGEMRLESPFYDKPEEGHMPELCARAIELGADALVFVQGRIYFSTNYGPRDDDFVPEGKAPTLTQVNTFNPESFAQGVTILAIRWLGDPPPGLPVNPHRHETARAAAPVEAGDWTPLTPVMTGTPDEAMPEIEELPPGDMPQMEDAIEEEVAPVVEEALPGEVGSTP